MNWADDEKIEMTAAERDMIARFTAAKCRPHGEVMAEKLDRFVQLRQLAAVSTANDYALAAASQTRHVPSGTPVAPSEDVMFVFASEAEEAGKAWRAELTVPANATVGTLLNLKVSGLGVDAVPQGVFFLAGANLPLFNGASVIPYEVFLAGIRDAEVSLKRPGGSCEQGQLMFM